MMKDVEREVNNDARVFYFFYRRTFLFLLILKSWGGVYLCITLSKLDISS